MLKCFKYFLIYILRYFVSKSETKKFELYQVFTHSFLRQNGKIFITTYTTSLCVPKCSNTSVLYTTDALKALLRKNRFYYFFLSFDMQKFYHLLRGHAIGINSSLIFFLSALLFLNLLCETKNLTIFL